MYTTIGYSTLEQEWGVSQLAEFQKIFQNCFDYIK